MDLSDQEIEKLADAIISNKKLSEHLLRVIVSRIYSQNDFLGWKEHITSAVLRRRDEALYETIAKMDKWLKEHFEPQSEAWFKRITKTVNCRLDNMIADAVDKSFNKDIQDKTRATIFNAAEKVINKLKISVDI